MEINSSNITQVQQSQQQPQQQQEVERRAFEEDLASQEQAQQAVEAVPAANENPSPTTDYTNLIREARVQQATAQSVQAPASANESDQTQDAQHIAVTAYQNNQESYEAATSSGQLLPRVDAIV